LSLGSVISKARKCNDLQYIEEGGYWPLLVNTQQGVIRPLFYFSLISILLIINNNKNLWLFTITLFLHFLDYYYYWIITDFCYYSIFVFSRLLQIIKNLWFLVISIFLYFFDYYK
jgi:hypothetical protein